jgi:RNA polymerase sigma-70 factor (ECF subfamily)
MQRELVQRAQQGDGEAFSSLARASLHRQYAVATLILRDGDRAQDAVQEALVTAWRDLRALRDPDAWDAWLYRLTVRACHRLARSERRRSIIEIHAPPDAETPGVLDLTISVVDRDRLERRLGDLPIDHRTILVLRFYLDLPLTEAATILDIPVGTARSRLHRAIAAMRFGMSAEPEATMRPTTERTA